MTQLRVAGRDGVARLVDAIDGSSLMETLREAGFDVDGTCGGECSCGTCHVYIEASALPRLPPRGEDEQLMLEAIGELVELRPGSRLSCQIRVTPGLEGIQLQVGPVP